MRRRLGSDISATKSPFMPRLAQLLDQVLVTQGHDRGVHSACAAILLCFYFGWRSSTVAVLSSSDVSVDQQLRVVQFSERFSKGSFQVRQYQRVLQLPADRLEGLYQFLLHFSSQHPPVRLLVDFAVARPLDAALQYVLKSVVPIFSNERFQLSSHCIRVGTCCILLKLGLSEASVKSWVGWSPSSTAWLAYVRFPYYSDAELQFSRLLFAQALPFT